MQCQFLHPPQRSFEHLWPKYPRSHDHNSRSVHLFETRRVPVQRAVERDEIPVPVQSPRHNAASPIRYN